jgi:hypothetical protein
MLQSSEARPGNGGFRENRELKPLRKPPPLGHPLYAIVPYYL